MALDSDLSLAEKLKRENCEQFHTLVRMHLSFVLDLHTDDNECVAEKAKFKKWSLFPKKSKSRGVMEGAPLTQEGICQVYQLIEFLSKEPNISQEGIFRRTGSLNRQQELRLLLNTGTTLDLDGGPYSVHDCASVLKSFLAELPEPLLTDAHYVAHQQIAELCGGVTAPNEPRLLRSLQLLLLLLPAENRVLLKDVLELLNLVASYEHSNKMSSDSLATLFTPHLLCPRKLSPEALHQNSQTMSPLVSFMIRKGKKLFEIPPKLATDIRAYILEREKKRILSPLPDLNESVSDNNAANTVYSFVDRERTLQAHSSNPTEAALAQLYAHIQSLPESSKKKKLIKQFNKENGQGTPLQIQYAGSGQFKKGLGDSIKKHLFQKSLLKKQQNTPQFVLKKNRTRCNSDDDLLNNTPEPSTNCCLMATPKLKTAKACLFIEPPEAPIENEEDNKENEINDTEWSNSYLTSTPTKHTNEEPSLITPSWTQQERLSTELFTPIGRKSMSPITRSARCMSKAMQESIMTPRSRKPVLFISNTNICQLTPPPPIKNISETLNTSSSSSENASTSKPTVQFIESTDESSSNHTTPLISDENMSNLDDSSFQEMSKDALSTTTESSNNKHCLSNEFREYLLTRSVSPTDASFSSREDDDFDDSIEEPCLVDDKLSESLLYCLDGNNPSTRKRRQSDIEEKNSMPQKHLVLKTRKLSETGDVVYETSL